MLFKIGIFLCLAFAFSGAFYLLQKSKLITKKLKEAYQSMDAASLQRARENKRGLVFQEGKKRGWLDKYEHLFLYSGLKRRFPSITVEIWSVCILLSSAGAYGVALLIGKDWFLSILAMAGDIFILIFLEMLLAMKNYKAVDSNLMEFLNLLGNYSITAGEVTGVFHQISRYLEEPLQSALDECYYEAQTSGNTDIALLALADKIEHPKFKELISSIEVCARYSADFSLVVSNSRKIIQDAARARQERKALASEALVNIFLISVLSVVLLVIADQLVEGSIWSIMLHTPIGWACMAIVGAIYLFFYMQLVKAER